MSGDVFGCRTGGSEGAPDGEGAEARMLLKSFKAEVALTTENRESNMSEVPGLKRLPSHSAHLKTPGRAP